MNRRRSLAAAVAGVILTGLVGWMTWGSTGDSAIAWMSGGVGVIAGLALVAIMLIDPSNFDERGRKTAWVFPVALSSILVAVASISRGMAVTAVACGIIAMAAVVYWLRAPSASAATRK